jgi:hypothetical protein
MMARVTLQKATCSCANGADLRVMPNMQAEAAAKVDAALNGAEKNAT